MALAFPDFLPRPLTFRPYANLTVSKFFIRISCNAIPTNPQSEDVVQKRQRRHNAMKQFLLEECGLSPSQLTAVITKQGALFRRKSTDTVQNALRLLRDSGFSPEQVRKTILRHPCVLSLKVDEKLKPKIELFKTLGLAEEDVGNVISQHPRILSYSLDKNLTPKIPLLLKLFGSKYNFSKAIKTAPFILLYDFETLENKVRNIKTLGLLEDEINKLVLKYPLVLALSKDKLRKNMNFLTDTAGFRPSILVNYAHFLSYSVEKRLKPRYKVFEYLTAMPNSKHLTISLATMLCLSERDFAIRFLVDRPEVTLVYKKYKGIH